MGVGCSLRFKYHFKNRERSILPTQRLIKQNRDQSKSIKIEMKVKRTTARTDKTT